MPPSTNEQLQKQVESQKKEIAALKQQVNRCLSMLQQMERRLTRVYHSNNSLSSTVATISQKLSRGGGS